MTRKGLKQKGMIHTGESFITLELPCGIVYNVNTEREYELKLKLHRRKCSVCDNYIKSGGITEVELINTHNKGWA